MLLNNNSFFFLGTFIALGTTAQLMLPLGPHFMLPCGPQFMLP